MDNSLTLPQPIAGGTGTAAARHLIDAVRRPATIAADHGRHRDCRDRLCRRWTADAAALRHGRREPRRGGHFGQRHRHHQSGHDGTSGQLRLGSDPSHLCRLQLTGQKRAVNRQNQPASFSNEGEARAAPRRPSCARTSPTPHPRRSPGSARNNCTGHRSYPPSRAWWADEVESIHARAAG